ncbi:MAG: hypothetical protein F9K29_21345 [Hyphomicrobiaceae bacterium]|nr:MAG: hypothetical protein F9K29_21345 [Hyphomicrobiaceae bacterium]
MVRDEREEEREFLSELKARTGKDLAEWMAAITAERHADKNETIDWLRAQGFPFARASWLERIHSNGGRPIYLHDEPVPKAAPAPLARPATTPAAARPAEKPRPKPAPALTAGEAELLEKLVAAAKGYRPLYHMLEAEVRKAVPDAVIAPRPGYVSIGAPREFGAVTLHASEIRLGLDLGERPFDALVQRAKLKGPGPAIAHMVVLTDARQVNDELMRLIAAANARVNG